MLRAEQVLQMEERGTRLPAQNALSLTRTCLLPIFVSRPCLPTLWQDKYHGSGNDLAATEPWLRRTLIDNREQKPTSSTSLYSDKLTDSNIDNVTDIAFARDLQKH